MNKKGSLELSVNAIVILIIALAILGLVIGFAVTKFNDLSSQLVFDEETPDATYDVPISFPGGRSTLTLTKGENIMELKIYNYQNADLSMNTTNVTCSPNEFDYEISSTVETLSAGELTSVPLTFQVNSTTPPKKYACKVYIYNSTNSSYFIARSAFFNIE